MTELSSSIRALTAEQALAQTLAARLAGRPWPDRIAVVSSERSFWLPSFVELAIAIARDRHTEPQEAEGWAELAVQAIGPTPATRSQELEPLAWAVLGNARRRRGDLGRARQALVRSRELRWQTADPLELAEIYSFEASYWTQVREYDVAANLVLCALALAGPHATPAGLSRYQVQAGMIASAAGRWREAVAGLLPIVERLDPIGHPTLVLSAAHNLAAACMGLGLVALARRALCGLDDLYRRFGDRNVQLQRDWLLARAARAEGAPGEAEMRLEAVRDGYLDAGIPYDAALVELELAELAADRDDWSTVEEAALAAAAALHAAGSPQEAVAGVAMVAEVARRQGSSELLLRMLESARRLTQVGGGG